MNYPELKYSNVNLELITDKLVIDKILQEIARDLEYRANLNPDYVYFETNYKNTWDKEYYIIKLQKQIIGYLKIMYDSRWDRTSSLLIVIKKEYRHKGYALKAAKIALMIIFEIMGMNKLNSCVFGYNKESIKIQQRFLKLEGIRRDDIYWMGKYWNKYLFGLTKKEYFNTYRIGIIKRKLYRGLTK